MTLSTTRPRTRPVPTGPPVDAPSAADDAIASWRAWRATRAAELRRPHGWLSLTGFAWLAPTALEVPGLPGRWSADEDTVTLTAHAGDGLFRVVAEPTGSRSPAVDPAADPFVVPAGGPLSGTVTFPVADGASVEAVRHGDRHVELLRRAGRPALRIRDPHAPTRTGFRGVPTYEWDQRWVVPARFVPNPEPVSEVVLTARPELLTTATTRGRIDFLLQDHPLSLAATRTPDGGLIVGFRDATNGVTTAPWRVLSVAAPDSEHGVVLDFNRAVNPPFTFTAFGTCPAPVAANRLPVPVTAGELAPTTDGDAR